MNAGNFDSLEDSRVVNKSFLDEYRKHMGTFRDELIILHTNLSLLRQMHDFDYDLFGG